MANDSNSKKQYRTLNDKNSVNYTIMDNGQFIMDNGMLECMLNGAGDLIITVDVNGLNKKSNRLGLDLQMFHIKNGKLLPMNAAGTRWVYANNIRDQFFICLQH